MAGFDLAPACEIGVDHHAGGVEGAKRDRPEPEALGRLVHRVVRRRGPLANEDGVARPIRRVRRLVEIVEKQQRLAGLRVAKLDAIGKTRFPVGDARLTLSLKSSSSGSPNRWRNGAGSRPLMRKDMTISSCWLGHRPQ